MMEACMSNYQTLKNSLKKLETQQEKTEKKPHCGVITYDEYEKLTFTDDRPHVVNGNKVGYLLVPKKLTLEEWEALNG